MNSRPQVSNHQELAEQISFFTRHAAKHGTRAIVVACAPPVNWLAEFSNRYGYHYVSVHSATDRADRISQLLGTERLQAAIQLAATPDHGLLAALAGTVRAGGILLIGTAEQSPESARSQQPIEQPSTQSYATQRLIHIAERCAEAFPQQALCAQFDHVGRRTSGPQHSTTSAGDHFNSNPTRSAAYLNPEAVVEQESLFEKACRHIETDSRASLVITGRRGRGKSTLLARIAEHMQQNNKAYKITAMNASALRTFCQHSESLSLHYVSPESVVTEHIETLFVDEASSFSLKQLQSFMKHCQRLVICSTVEGYESTGRALEIRLLPELAISHPGLLQLEPIQPWRWANNDPLETFIDELLLAKPALLPSHTAVTPLHLLNHPLKHCRVLHISQHELADNEALLAQIQALLSATHYQSSAKDLEHLLDAPSVQLWAQKLGPNVVAVVLLEREGCIDVALHEPIVSKKRRLPNQLLPQLLAQTANSVDALSSRYIRVLRIAVIPELRRKRLATSLLESVERELTTSDQAVNSHQLSLNIHAIGASFAADERSLAFWNSLGYTEFHRGYRANPRTGKPAVAVMKSLTTKTHTVLAAATKIHRTNELARQSLTDQSIIRHAPVKLTGIHEQSELRLLTRFAKGQRSVHDTYAALCWLSQIVSLPLSKKQDQSQRDYECELRQKVKRWIASNIS